MATTMQGQMETAAPGMGKGDYSFLQGARNSFECAIQEQHLASTMGTGEVQTLDTAVLIQLIEMACLPPIRDRINPDETSVSTYFDFKHFHPTPAGMKVRANIEVADVQENRVRFHFEILDDKEKVAEGVHERRIVNKQDFMRRATTKYEARKAAQ
jgi:fluoroacetyl-CoA thioesterase